MHSGSEVKLRKDVHLKLGLKRNNLASAHHGFVSRERFEFEHPSENKWWWVQFDGMAREIPVTQDEIEEVT